MQYSDSKGSCFQFFQPAGDCSSHANSLPLDLASAAALPAVQIAVCNPGGNGSALNRLLGAYLDESAGRYYLAVHRSDAPCTMPQTWRITLTAAGQACLFHTGIHGSGQYLSKEVSHLVFRTQVIEPGYWETFSIVRTPDAQQMSSFPILRNANPLGAASDDVHAWLGQVPGVASGLAAAEICFRRVYTKVVGGTDGYCSL